MGTKKKSEPGVLMTEKYGQKNKKMNFVWKGGCSHALEN